MHHTKSDIDQLYLARMEASQGVIQLQLSQKTENMCLFAYLQRTNGCMLKAINYVLLCVYQIPGNHKTM